MYNRQKIGKKGEDISCQYLEKNNYKIIEKNFNCIQGEIDIIAYDINRNEIVFIEVKTRTSFNYGLPSEAVNTIKKHHIKRSIEYYLYKTNRLDCFVRVDVIEVVVHGNKYKLNHLKNVF